MPHSMVIDYIVPEFDNSTFHSSSLHVFAGNQRLVLAFFLQIKKNEEDFVFQDPITVRGNPDIQDNSFEGASIRCAWTNNPLMMELSSVEGRFLSSNLRTKQQIVEVRIG